MNKKRRQHYVWQKYLEPWTHDGKIACSRQGKLFTASTKNVGLETDMYKLVELSDKEIAFVRTVLIEESHAAIKEVQEGWIEAFQAPFRIRKEFHASGSATPESAAELEVMIHNAEEDLHARIEGDAIPLLDKLLSGEIDFYNDEDMRARFLQFLCTQYSRTATVRDRVLSLVEASRPKLKRPLEFDFARLLPLIRHIVATGLAYGIHIRFPQVRLYKLESAGAFITGDQPAVNASAVGLAEGEQATELELYYPVSPDRAILIADRGDVYTPAAGDIERFNRAVLHFSRGVVYGRSEEDLSALNSLACQ